MSDNNFLSKNKMAQNIFKEEQLEQTANLLKDSRVLENKKSVGNKVANNGGINPPEGAISTNALSGAGELQYKKIQENKEPKVVTRYIQTDSDQASPDTP